MPPLRDDNFVTCYWMLYQTVNLLKVGLLTRSARFRKLSYKLGAYKRSNVKCVDIRKWKELKQPF